MARYVAGKRLPWRRWWLGEGDEVRLDEHGMFRDPEGTYGSFLNPAATALSEHASAPCVVLLGDAGSGKSEELKLHAEELGADRSSALYVDLGGYADWQDLRSDVFEDRLAAALEAGDAPVVLVLDGVDEAPVSPSRLADGVARRLANLPLDRIRLRVGSRPSAWPAHAAEAIGRLWNGAETLRLAPLTGADVATAADAALGGGSGFIEEVRRLGLGPLAARPITLRFLLTAAAAGHALPKDRAAVYAEAIPALAAEQGDRRTADRAAGPPLQQRVAAAEHVAAVSLLSGRHRLVQRFNADAAPGALALESLAAPELDLAVLDALWDSALMTSAGTMQMTWTHHSVAEYLCARRLSALPHAAVRHLLAHPDDVRRVVPQLGGVASWLAVWDGDAFAWLADAEPDLLLGPGLDARPGDQRSALGRSLIEALRRGEEAPRGHRRYHGFAYEGLDADLAPLISDGSAPVWARREAIRIVMDNGIREHDGTLVEMIENAAAKGPGAEHDDDLELASWASVAVEPTDQALVDRLVAVASDEGAPAAVRADVVTLLWPRLGAAQALDLLPNGLLSHRRDPLARGIAGEVRRAVEEGSVDPLRAVCWLRGHPRTAHHESGFQAVAGAAVLAAAAVLGPGDRRWEHLGELCAGQFTTPADMFDWDKDATGALSEQARRTLALAALRAAGTPTPSDARELAACGLIRDDDYGWWLEQYASSLDGAEPDAAAESAAISLTRPDKAVEAVARGVAEAYPKLVAWVSAWFSDENFARYEHHIEATKHRAEEEARRASERLFDPARLASAVEGGDWPAVAAELGRPVARDRESPHGTPLSMRPPWSTLPADQRDVVVDMAASFLRDASPEPDKAGAAAHAFALLAETGGRLLEVPDLARWLAAVFDLPGHHEAAAGMLRAVADAGDDEAERVVLAKLRSELNGAYVGVIHRLGAYTSPALEEELLAAARRDATHPDILRDVLPCALGRRPREASEIALELIASRPETRPTRRKDEAVDIGAPPHREWHRAVRAACALAASPALGENFEALMGAFRSSPEFAEDVILHLDLRPAYGPAFSALVPEQAADLYLWARENLRQRRRRAPGEDSRADPVEDFPDDILGRLRAYPTPAAAAAMDRIAEATGSAWLRLAAAETWDAVRERNWSPLAPDDVLAVLSDARRRVVTTEAQLVEVLLDAIDAVAAEAQRDTTVRRWFWHRQQGKERLYMPNEENEFSDTLMKLVSQRLEKIVIRREVELQPGLGRQAGEFPDFEAIALVDTDEVTCAGEAKGNWHDDVLTAIEDQLYDRYLRGPRARTGVYVVGWYAGGAWDPEDWRRAKAQRFSREELQTTLEAKAAELSVGGRRVHVRVIDLTLERSELE